MVIPVIKYIMDYILATFVCWFKISLFSFCSLFCFHICGLTGGIPKSLIVGASFYSQLVVISNIKQLNAASDFRESCYQLFCIEASSWGTKADFYIICCLSGLLEKRF